MNIKQTRSAAEIVVIEDEGGYAFFGDSAQLDSWLTDEGLSYRAAPLDSPTILNALGGLLQKTNEVMTESCRWVRLTPQSAQLLKKYGGQSGVVRNTGKIVKHLRFEKVGTLVNPSTVAGLGGMMVRLSLEQMIREVSDYLGRIETKLDVVLADQQDRQISELAALESAISKAERVFSISDQLDSTNWSQIEDGANITTSAQQYSLRKITGAAQNLHDAESAKKMEQAAANLKETLLKWLPVIAGCRIIEDRFTSLEIAWTASQHPETFQANKIALAERRTERISECHQLIDHIAREIQRNADYARGKKALHPLTVDSTIAILDSAVHDLEAFANALSFDKVFGDIDQAPSWRKAILEAIAATADSVKDFGDGTKNAAVKELSQLRQKLPRLALPNGSRPALPTAKSNDT